jgi:hypothetical protein
MTFFLSACYDKPLVESRAYDGLEQSQLSDFNLPDYTQYFEIRRGEVLGGWSFEHQMMLQFDPQGYGQLDLEQQLDIAFIDTDKGFTQGCAPDSCPIYLASVGESVQVVDTPELLRAFLGEIDTPAECALWLLQHGFDLLTTHQYPDGTWILEVRDQLEPEVQFQLEMDVDGRILSQDLISQSPGEETLILPSVEITF